MGLLFGLPLLDSLCLWHDTHSGDSTAALCDLLFLRVSMPRVCSSRSCCGVAMLLLCCGCHAGCCDGHNSMARSLLAAIVLNQSVECRLAANKLSLRC